MIVQYVLKSLWRHRARTIIMTLALVVVTAMLVALNNGVESLQRQVVELVERDFGEHDLTLTRADTSPSQYVEVERISGILLGANADVAAVYPRFQATVELQGALQVGNATLLARVPEDELGQVAVVEGEYDLSAECAVILQVTADTFGLSVGDELVLGYVLPVSRLEGHELSQNMSVGTASRTFSVCGIALATGLGGVGQNGVLVGVDAVQEWLDVPELSERLVVVLDEGAYRSANTQASIFRVRRAAERMYDALGSEVADYQFSLDKAQALDFSDVAFAVLRSLTGVYGVLVMGVVGLLVYSIINTNVEERRRDLAFLRILGAKRAHLFGLVLFEVAAIGALGVGLGIVTGHALSLWVVAPLANYLIAEVSGSGTEVGITFQMAITVSAMVQAGTIAAAILLLSAIAPARKAAGTKVRYAINPGSADNIQIEDLARLRSRKFDVRIVIAGVVLTVMWGLIFIGTEFLFVQGNEAVISMFGFAGMILLVVGVSLLFYALTILFERVLILIGELVSPRLTFFAAPNLLRAKQRNTMISLMVVFSATLPTFLGTMAALEQQNYDVDARFRNGAPVVARLSRWGRDSSTDEPDLSPGILEEFAAVEGVELVAGLTSEYPAEVANRVELRRTSIQLQGITGSLEGIVYRDLTEYHSGDARAFEAALSEPDTLILGAGYAEFMDLDVGDEVRVPGVGIDHFAMMRVVGLIERMPGFEGFSRNENYVRWGQTPGLVSLDTYLRLTHDPALGAICPSGICLPDERDQPVLTRIMASVEGGADESEVVADLRELFADRSDVWVQSTAESIRTTEQSMRTVRVLMLIMTVLSFVTCIFGVFAVVYVSVHVRRLEIGMLKAIGMRKRGLTRAFALESTMMTVSASLAGVTAGTVLGYVFYLSGNLMQDRPTKLTFDWLTTLVILVMVILASVISSALAARGVVRQKVTEILREAW